MRATGTTCICSRRRSSRCSPTPSAASCRWPARSSGLSTCHLPDWACEKHFAWAHEFKPDVIVLFFGANVPQAYDAGKLPTARSFGDAVDALRTYLDPEGKALVLVSQGFYKRPRLDAEKEAVAKRHGDVFVRMEDLWDMKEAHGRYNHPGDLGMQLIADRFWSKMADRIRAFKR